MHPMVALYTYRSVSVFCLVERTLNDSALTSDNESLYRIEVGLLLVSTTQHLQLTSENEPALPGRRISSRDAARFAELLDFMSGTHGGRELPWKLWSHPRDG